MSVEAAGQDIINAFRAAMADAGIVTRDPITADGAIHRCHVDGDPRSRRNGWYILHLDGKAAGAFGCNKRMGAESIKWSAQGMKPLSTEERKAIAKKAREDRERRAAADAAMHARAAVKANEVWNAAKDVAGHPYLTRKGVKSHGLRMGDWVKEFTDQTTGEVTEKRVAGALLVPIRNSRREIVSLQGIFANKNNPLGRDKDYLVGGEKRGCFFSIGKPTQVAGKTVLVICEGYATGASIHEATGLAVLVAFDVRNLAPVSATARRLIPDATLLIAGDNDRWTEMPVKNPGITYGQEAAKAVDALFCAPEFQDLRGNPTDFNDLSASEGKEEVKRQIMGLIAPPEEVEPDHVASEPMDGPAPEPPPLDDIVPDPKVRARVKAALEEGDDLPDAHDPDDQFTVLGHDGENLYVFQHEAKKVMSRKIADWGKNALYSIGSMQWWEREFPGAKGISLDAAVNWLIRIAYRRGFYDPNMCRGRGAWLDHGRVVFHFGNRLTVDGVECGLTEIDSVFVYEQFAKLPFPAVDALSDEEGRKLFDLARKFRWQRPSSAILLSGWIALAPVCGALKWRPHFWLTGGSGSGKTTIMGEFVKPLMNGTALFAQGNSTEPGIRNELKCDALPVLFDESEQNDEREEQRIQTVISLARQSSSNSGARTYKGTTNGDSVSYHIQSMFGFSSVKVNIKHDADRDRIAVLALRPKRDKNEADPQWAEISEGLTAIGADDTMPARIMRRAINNLPTTLANIKTFITAAAVKFDSQREGDQYGTLIAGAWSLVSSKLVTPEEAARMLDRYDWSEYVEHADTDESTRALSALMSALIRLPRGDTNSVYELVSAAAGRRTDSNVKPKEAQAVLRRHGMAIARDDDNDEVLLISNNSTEIPKLLEGTGAGNDLKGQLLRLKEAKRWDKLVSFNGVKDRCVAISLSLIGEDPETDSPLPFIPPEDDVPF